MENATSILPNAINISTFFKQVFDLIILEGFNQCLHGMPGNSEASSQRTLKVHLVK